MDGRNGLWHACPRLQSSVPISHANDIGQSLNFSASPRHPLRDSPLQQFKMPRPLSPVLRALIKAGLAVETPIKDLMTIYSISDHKARTMRLAYRNTGEVVFPGSGKPQGRPKKSPKSMKCD
ncbi:hypothetical protein ABVK25_005144 [Lepraria finkii]|uniref:Uncharacterized protein n=1 Tax=Lepraria finkii TaxID=1340010 RepID=A0ABR4BBI7_9LECA